MKRDELCEGPGTGEILVPRVGMWHLRVRLATNKKILRLFELHAVGFLWGLEPRVRLILCPSSAPFLLRSTDRMEVNWTIQASDQNLSFHRLVQRLLIRTTDISITHNIARKFETIRR